VFVEDNHPNFCNETRNSVAQSPDPVCDFAA
jgi:hypothetical protein